MATAIMGQELSDADVFGATTPKPAPVELPDAAVFGPPAGSPAAPTQHELSNAQVAPPTIDTEALAQKQQQYEAENPFWTRVGQRLHKGGINVVSSYHAVRAGNLAQALQDTNDPNATSQEGLMARVAPPEVVQQHRQVVSGQLRDELTSLIGLQAKAGSIPTAPVAAATRGQSLGNALEAIKVDPLAWVAEEGITSLPGSAVAMAPAILAARRGGKVSGMAGMFAGSAITDYAGELAGELSQLGVDPNNPEAIQAALQDPNVLDRIKTRSGLHAIPVALLDALSFGVAGKTIAPVTLKPLLREAINIPAQAGVQGVMGGTGEALGQIARDGGITDWGDVLAEVGGEVMGTPVEVAGAAYGGMRGQSDTTIPNTQLQDLHKNSVSQAVQDAVNANQADLLQRSGINDASKQAASALVLEVEKTTSKLQDVLGASLARMEKEAAGRDILDNLAVKKISPKTVSETFWNETYFKLPAAAQAKFITYLKNLTGFQPGSVLATNGETGAQETAADWVHIAKFLREDLPSTVDGLEGTERGYVALMDEANRRASNSSSQTSAETQLKFNQIQPELNRLWQKAENLRGTASAPPPIDMPVQQALPLYRTYFGETLGQLKDIAEGGVAESLKAGGSRTSVPPAALEDAFYGFGFDPQPHTYFRPTLATGSPLVRGVWKQVSRPITSATNPEMVGRRLDTVTLKAGDVAVSGFEALKLEDPALITNMQEYVRSIAKMFAPNKSVVISDGMGEDQIATAQGKPQIDDAGRLFKIDPDTWVVSLFPRAHQTTDGIATSLKHEMGHMIALERLYESPPATRTAVAQDYLDYVKRSLSRPLYESLHEKYHISAVKSLPAYFEKAWPEFASDFYATPLRDVLKMNLPDSLRDMVHYWLDADEWIADQHVRYADHPNYGGTASEKFFSRTAEIVKRMFEKTPGGVAGFAPTQNYVNFLKAQRKERIKDALIGKTAGRQMADQLEVMQSKGIIPPGGSPQAVHQNPWAQAGEIDRFNRMMDQTYSIWQIAELNPHIVGLQSYVAGLEAMAQTKNKFLHQTEQRLVEMNNLGKERLGRVTELLLDETVAGVPSSPRDPAVVKKYDLDPEMINVIGGIKTDFETALTTMEQVLLADIIERLHKDPAAMTVEVAKLQKQMADMRAKPYFPLARFGNYTAVVRAKSDVVIGGKIYKKGSIVEMRTYESGVEQGKGADELAKDYAGKDVSLGKDYLEDVVFEFRGVPPQIFDTLKTQLKLTKRQEQQLDQYRIEVAPGRSFLKHLKKRNGIRGFSEDGERAYASYMSRMANHLARLQHYKHLSASMTAVGEDATRIQMAGTPDQITNATKRRKIHQYMAETYDYIMNPENEWTGVRSLAFMFHLGMNVKSALVNLTQLPIASYPKLAHQFGDARAVAGMGVAIKHTTDLWRRPSRVPQEVRDAVTWGVDAGILDQSFASMVAGVAEGHLLSRALPGSDGARLLRQTSHIASFMFSNMEKFNRHVTFIAAFKLARKQGVSTVEAQQVAKRTVRSTQFEYQKWARPKVFRGKKGAFLVFKMYQQGILYFLFHDKARMRMWLMLGLMSGAMGLPFGEDLADMIDWAMSHGNEKFDSRLMMRELIKNLHLKPDLILHGISRESFGLSAFASYLGIPFPKVDLSGSVGMGRVVPGAEMLQPSAKNFNEKLGSLTTQALGAGFAIPLALAQMVSEWDTQPDTVRKLERIMPDAMRSVSKAIRYYTDGGAQDTRGAVKTKLSWQDNEQRTEIIAQALGFNPTVVTQQQELDRITKNHTEFYAIRQQKLLQDFAYARIEGDKEALADVKRAIRDYNKEVPDSRLRISGQMIAKSVHSRLRSIARVERGRPPQGNKFRGLTRDIQQIFQDEADLTDVFSDQTTPGTGLE